METVCPIPPKKMHQSKATNPVQANMNILTASERAVTALQGRKLFNDF